MIEERAVDERRLAVVVDRAGHGPGAPPFEAVGCRALRCQRPGEGAPRVHDRADGIREVTRGDAIHGDLGDGILADEGFAA
jgi:hypothetical protein